MWIVQVQTVKICQAQTIYLVPGSAHMKYVSTFKHMPPLTFNLVILNTITANKH